MVGMEKEFDRWNEKKKAINDIVDLDFFYHEREIWWCALGANVGVEMDGKNVDFERPVLIVKKFNKEMFWGLPLSSKPRMGNLFHEIHYDRGVAWAFLSQFKTISSKRLLRKLGSVPELDFEEIKIKLSTFIMNKTFP